MSKTWAPLRLLRDILACRGSGVLIPVDAAPTGFRMVRPGDRVNFQTAHQRGTGARILEIDHGAHYPVRVQWHTPEGHMRIAGFHPDEFLSLQILQ